MIDQDEDRPPRRRVIQCSDRMCGADDCPNCRPENFRRGIFVEDEPEENMTEPTCKACGTILGLIVTDRPPLSVAKCRQSAHLLTSFEVHTADGLQRHFSCPTCRLTWRERVEKVA